MGAGSIRPSSPVSVLAPRRWARGGTLVPSRTLANTIRSKPAGRAFLPTAFVLFPFLPQPVPPSSVHTHYMGPPDKKKTGVGHLNGAITYDSSKTGGVRKAQKRGFSTSLARTPGNL